MPPLPTLPDINLPGLLSQRRRERTEYLKTLQETENTTITPAIAAGELLRRQECRDSFERFCEEVLKTRGYAPAKHHRLIIHELSCIAAGLATHNRVLFTAPPGSGKALALDTPIPTPSGWTTIGRIEVGDLVFDEYGLPCSVIWKSPVWHDRLSYKLATDCGDTIIADSEHEWRVRMNRDKRPDRYGNIPAEKAESKTTEQLSRAFDKRPLIDRAQYLKLPDADLPIAPYLLGVWLGDGNSDGPRITSGLEDIDWLRGEISCLGYATTNQSASTQFGVLGIRGVLCGLDLIYDPWHNCFGRKHIPDIYLRAGRFQRLDLLQGLIDSDGHVTPLGEVEFTSTNPRLASGVAELVRSLGAKAGISEGRAKLGGKDCGPKWRVHFYLKDAARMPRKQERTKDGARTANTYIDVEPFEPIDTACIQVDSPSHLYLCGASMTPTHNSTYVTVLFPTWLFQAWPGCQIIGASHTGDLAEDFSRKIHAVIRDEERVLQYSLASENAGRWYTTNRGAYLAAGVGAAIPGFRADIAIIDDPIRGRLDADSEARRKTVWDWYNGDLDRRRTPDAPIIIMHTRWHQDDLAGRILLAEAHKWRVVHLPAEAEEDDILGRQPGEFLWSDDAYGYGHSLREIRDDLFSRGAAREWYSQYQGTPRPPEGAFFKTARIETIETPAIGGKTIRAWDLAASRKSLNSMDPDWTRGVKLSLQPNKRIAIEDVVGCRGGPDEVERLIYNTAGRDGRNVKISLPQDPGQAGKVQAAYYGKLLHGYIFEFTPETGSKITRADPIASQVNNGNVDIVRGAWNASFLAELGMFPSGAHEDQVDALSRGYGALVGVGKPFILTRETLSRFQERIQPPVWHRARNRFARHNIF